ncbi:unnamed protein product, partial [Coregonus sp. 'balchen']
MLYKEFLRLWDEAVKAVDARDWQGALSKLNQITEPTSRTLFLTASAHLALGQLEPAIQALDQTIAKDERLAVGFFQRAGAFMLASRLEEALNDCISAQKHMRGNMVIDYKQLGLCYKLYSWQTGPVGQSPGHPDLSLPGERKRGARREHGSGFRHYLCKDSRYMRLRTPYISQGPGQLTVPGGAMVFLFSDVERDGLATVIHDGQKGLVPMTLLDPVDVKKSKGRKNNKSIPSGIPLPPDLRPPTRPQESPVREASLPSYATHPPNTSTPLPKYTSTVDSPTELTEDPLANRTILYQMVALYDYAAEGPEDLEFSEGDTIDILSEVNEEWLEGHC